MRPRVRAYIREATNANIVELVTMAARDPIASFTDWPAEFDPDRAPELVWELLRSLHYVADLDGQTVKAPRVLLATGTGDCKSYSVLAAKALQAAGWAVWLRFVKNEQGNNFQHVYVYAERAGRSVIVDGVFDQFNAEPLHFGSVDIPCAT